MIMAVGVVAVVVLAVVVLAVVEVMLLLVARLKSVTEGAGGQVGLVVCGVITSIDLGIEVRLSSVCFHLASLIFKK